MSESSQEKNFPPFPPEKARALAALLLSGNNQHAADASGVNERTIRRWRAEPEFQSALQTAVGAALEGFNAVVASACGAAVLKLRSFALSSTATPAHQLRASATLAELGMRQQELAIRQADLAMRLKEHEEFERRLTALEQGNGKS